jgi:DMSO reductase anchor subunit
MKPAFSVITFTTVAGAAQGLVVAMACAALAGMAGGRNFTLTALAVALLMLLAGLGASFLHLGRPERAWRAMAMWRTSWLSREVIVLPVFMGVVALWWLRAWLGSGSGTGSAPVALLALVIALAALLWLCTAQIYACLRFIQEWAHPLTLVSFTLIGLASGTLLATALAASFGETALKQALLAWALPALFAAWVVRITSLLRNASLKPKSTAQSATGIRSDRLVQASMGMTGGAFNTREFFHGASEAFIRHVRLAVHALGFALPAALLVAARDASASQSLLLWLAVASQVPGLLAEGWLFFAQARHPQNLYYQRVS